MRQKLSIAVLASILVASGINGVKNQKEISRGTFGTKNQSFRRNATGMVPGHVKILKRRKRRSRRKDQRHVSPVRRIRRTPKRPSSTPATSRPKRGRRIRKISSQSNVTQRPRNFSSRRRIRNTRPKRLLITKESIYESQEKINEELGEILQEIDALIFD